MCASTQPMADMMEQFAKIMGVNLTLTVEETSDDPISPNIRAFASFDGKIPIVLEGHLGGVMAQVHDAMEIMAK